MTTNKCNALRLWGKQFSNASWATDFSGRKIKKDEYGEDDSPYGWNIDHIKPKSKGGVDDETNLICCNIQTNREKGSHYPNFLANDLRFKVENGKIVPIKDEKEGVSSFFNPQKVLAILNDKDFLKEKIFFGKVVIEVFCFGTPAESVRDQFLKIYSVICYLFKDIGEIWYERTESIWLVNVDVWELKLKSQTEDVFKRCLLLHTYGQKYFLPQQFANNLSVSFGMDCRRLSEKPYYPNVPENRANEFWIDQTVKINLPSYEKYFLNDREQDGYKCNFFYKNLSEKLIKIQEE